MAGSRWWRDCRRVIAVTRETGGEQGVPSKIGSIAGGGTEAATGARLGREVVNDDALILVSLRSRAGVRAVQVDDRARPRLTCDEEMALMRRSRCWAWRSIGRRRRRPAACRGSGVSVRHVMGLSVPASLAERKTRAKVHSVASTIV